MTCPACPPSGKCSACLSEGVAKRGRPPKGYKPKRLTVWVHPDFPPHLESMASKGQCSLGEAVQRAFQFTPKPKTK